MDESQVDVEEMFNIMKQQSKVQEKPDAKLFEYKGGEIEFWNLKYSYKRAEG